MLRPPSFLRYARTLLEVTVREASLEDVDRVEKFLSEPTPPGGGWDKESAELLLARLDQEASVQAETIRLAVGQGGSVSRDQVYELGGYAEDRSLRGFTRPIYRIAEELRRKGVVPGDAVDVLTAVYDVNSPKFGWAAGFKVNEDVLPVLESLGDALGS